MRLGQAQHSKRSQDVLLSLLVMPVLWGALIRTILGRHQQARLVAPLAMSGECMRQRLGLVLYEHGTPMSVLLAPHMHELQHSFQPYVCKHEHWGYAC